MVPEERYGEFRKRNRHECPLPESREERKEVIGRKTHNVR
jgi:hypothetical protein